MTERVSFPVTFADCGCEATNILVTESCPNHLVTHMNEFGVYVNILDERYPEEPAQVYIHNIARAFKSGDYTIPTHGQDATDRYRDECEVCEGTRGGLRGNENFVNGKVMCDYCSADFLQKDPEHQRLMNEWREKAATGKQKAKLIK